jgi:primosomal protein N' (replication factor Y) (superfamily II helicase)
METSLFSPVPETPERLTLFAEVILPVPVAGTFTYRVPHELNDHLLPGARVVVPFGKRRILTAIVRQIHQNPPKNYQAKYIMELLDERPVVSEPQLALWEWVADYYMCTLGEVMNVALPAGMKLSSESRIQLHPDFAVRLLNADLPDLAFSAKEQRLIDALQDNDSYTFAQAAELLEVQQISHIVKSLLQKEVVLIYEEVKDKYRPKLAKRVRLATGYIGDEIALAELLDRLAAHKKNDGQTQVLMRYFALLPFQAGFEAHREGVLKSSLMDGGLSESSLKTLLKNQVLEEYETIVPRFGDSSDALLSNIQLTDYQKEIAGQVLNCFEEKNVVLLHGVTGSGKTEIYIELIRQVLATGQQVLFLLPEIALTTQIVGRLRKVFGNQMGVYHSRFSDNERVEVWRGVLTDRFPLVVGVRSAILLPLSQVGLIIVDEEHDPSYKQYDPAPRYHARDLAMVMAHQHQAKVLLGSATPSLESYWMATQGRYALVKADRRYNDAELPGIELVNTSVERKLKKLKGEFSSLMLDSVEARLQRKEQVILFQNRRGYAPHLTCDECGWVPKCANCDVSLTYHLQNNELRCHYCGYRESPPSQCHDCSATKIRPVGYGTEKLEDELKLLLPSAAVQRMDLDTTRSKHSYQHIIEDFANQKIDVLVGTQMVTKGLDFDHVSLVGVFDIDRLLHYPDFRAHERAFQLVTQVSGRAGRKQTKGQVLVQTGNPLHPVLAQVVAHDYEGFYRAEIGERFAHGYPPFMRLIRLTVKGEDLGHVADAAAELAGRLRGQLGASRVLGPEAPPVERIRNLYLRDVLVKLERDKVDLKKVKRFILDTIQEIGGGKNYRQLLVVPDVDPI